MIIRRITRARVTHHSCVHSVDAFVLFVLVSLTLLLWSGCVFSNIFLAERGGEEIPSNKRKQCRRFIASNIYSVPFLFSYVRNSFRNPFSSGSDSIFLTMLSYRNNGTVMHKKYSTYFWCRPGFLNFSVLWIRNDLFRIRFRIQLFAIFYFILQFYSTQSPEFKDK